MKLNKIEFLNTEFGREMVVCAGRIDIYCRELSGCDLFSYDYNMYLSLRSEELARLEVFKLAVKQFYSVEYCFTRTDDYYGLVTEDGLDWLLKRPIH